MPFDSVKMSFETGRTSGLVGSLIEVIVPIAIFAMGGLLILSLFSAFLGAATSGSTGFVGTPLLSLTLIPFLIIAFVLIGLAGFILFVFSMYRLSQYYNEPGIFKDVIYGVIIVVVGIATIIALVVIVFLFSRSSSGVPPSFAFSFLALFLGAIVLQIIVSIFFMRAFNKLSEKSGVDSFHTAGLLILIGAVTSIIGVGGIIGWIAWIFAASGFYSLKPKPTVNALFYNAPPASSPTPTPSLYCSYCGAQISNDSIYCPNCGRQIRQ